MTILVVTNSKNMDMELIPCNSKEDAKNKLVSIFETLCEKNRFDVNNTFYAEEECYAQIVNGLESYELRIGEL